MELFANIVVAAVIALLLFLAIRTVVRQRKDGGCGSCSKKAGSCPSGGCNGCPFSGQCHK